MSKSIIPNDAYIMIIGAMKSGTTTLYWHLTQHPKICSCVHKEPEYFSENQGHGVSVPHYSDLWDYDPNQHRYVLEASTGYTKYPCEPNVADKIKAYGITPTFLYVVRDPFMRIESDYNFSLDKEWFDPKLPITDDRYVSISNYFMQLEPYRKQFGVTNILVLDFDELVSNPAQLLTSVFDRLQLSSTDIEIVDEVKHKTRELSKAEVFLTMHPGIKSVTSLLPHSVKQFMKGLYEPVSQISQKKQLTTEERAIIHTKLQNHMSLFQKHYGFHVEKWGFS
ncbi:MAG: sulfotransferase [Nitrospirales bacterium]|nr:MAG: sulfotransferase [Nitrospirales bacterium]